ncbi:hypothetical protein [Methylobacterium sp. J-090]|uniref:hypothetical protein n=1 Tax=Methylobacterium sp. J-090 TaxID=2836666 RepID=UPI001FB8EEBA|nr:hypothetical protein [Methylobacterium sp. J-090]MCJ2080734.1 hypothetical protein [Methylobacterium sp. J-090]
MSQIAKEFFRDWVASNLDPDKPAKLQLHELLQDADGEGITQEEMGKAFSGDLLKAMTKAIAKANQS